MSFLFGRSSRTSTTRPWFYAVMAIGFAGLAVWAATQGDWLVAGFAALMVIVTGIGGQILVRALARRETSSEIADEEAAGEVLP